MNSFVTAILPAAGTGSRMGTNTPKQFIRLKGRPLFYYALEAFDRCETVNQMILAVPASYIQTAEKRVAELSMNKKVNIIAGGKERQDSVFNGLAAADDKADLILVHDGVRPFVTVDLISRVIQNAAEYGAAVAAIPETDTVKRIHDGWIEETLERSSIWRIQTPQCFRADWLRDAYEKAARDKVRVTDDSALIEKMGKPVRIVEGDYFNIKVTTPVDLMTAEYILKERDL